jgi:hypothetical protein
MDAKKIDSVSKQVRRTYPEMDGCAPSVKRQPSPADGTETFLLTYRGRASLPGGKSLNRIVRVVTDSGGRILRISSSK